MRCEIVAIGTELLLGQIVDSNSAWMGEQLALSGIDSFHQVKVGDNHRRIVDSLKLALSRSEAVICCGGLGPTQDDITREAIAEVMGVSLRRDMAMGERIRHMFESRGRTMPENNLRQAELPEGARFIAEMPGTAPGLICPIGKQVIYAVPGVPSEMHAMMRGTILPDLIMRSGETSIIRSRVLRTWGQSESGLAEMLAAHMKGLDKTGRATLAFQASGIEGIKVRITVKAPDETTAQCLLNTEDEVVSGILGKYVFGRDQQTMESMVLEGLRQRGLTLALAESATGGHIGLRLSARDEAEGVFLGGLILVDARMQARLLGVPESDFPNPETTASLAAAVRAHAGADVGLATCAVDDRKEVPGVRSGTVFIGIATANGAHTERVQLPGDRARIREYAVISALNALRQRVLA